MKSLLKSLAAGLFGAGLFFSFFMMFSISVINVAARLHGPNAPLQAPDVLLTTGPWYRIVGISLSAVAFVVCFALVLKRSRKPNSAPPIGTQDLSEGHGFSRAGQEKKVTGFSR